MNLDQLTLWADLILKAVLIIGWSAIAVALIVSLTKRNRS